MAEAGNGGVEGEDGFGGGAGAAGGAPSVSLRETPPPEGEELFLPVPLRPRADGWTAERQRAFLENLAACGSVAAAARRVTVRRVTVTRGVTVTRAITPELRYLERRIREETMGDHGVESVQG